MTIIRIDTDILEQEAKKIEGVGANAKSVGRSLLGITANAPSYGGQFGPVVQSISAGAFARAQGFSGRLADFGNQLDERASAFETADMTGALSLQPWGSPQIWESINPMGRFMPIWISTLIMAFPAAVIRQYLGLGEITQSTPPPPPRVYLVNGIASQTLSGPDSRMKHLEKVIINKGYDPDQVKVVDAVYNNELSHLDEVNWRTDFHGTDLHGTKLTGTNLDGSGVVFGSGAWIANTATGVGAWLINGITGFGSDSVNRVTGVGAEGANQISDDITDVTNRGVNLYNEKNKYGVGIAEVIQEYALDEKGKYSDMVLDQIYNDIYGPDGVSSLAPGQEVILIGHSGGGAIVTNIADDLEARDIPVEGVVTMGSPMARVGEANNVARVVEIQANSDGLVGGWKDVFTMGRSSEQSIGNGDHGSYIEGASDEVVKIIADEFRSFKAGIN
jgi:hypothetical protein